MRTRSEQVEAPLAHGKEGQVGSKSRGSESRDPGFNAIFLYSVKICGIMRLDEIVPAREIRGLSYFLSIEKDYKCLPTKCLSERKEQSNMSCTVYPGKRTYVIAVEKSSCCGLRKDATALIAADWDGFTNDNDSPPQSSCRSYLYLFTRDKSGRRHTQDASTSKHEHAPHEQDGAGTLYGAFFRHHMMRLGFC